jgi:DNA-directed RNA polymerase II subunit RPB7
MFFHITLNRVIQLQPKFFGPNLRNTLIDKLHSEVEGTCSGRYGFIITVTAVEEIGVGKIQHSSGSAQFQVFFKAIGQPL